MKKLLTFIDLLLILPVSESTLRRYIAKARRGTGNFPLPVNEGFKRKLLFRPEDIERWVATQNSAAPQPPIPESSRERSKRHSAAMKILAQKGVTLGSRERQLR